MMLQCIYQTLNEGDIYLCVSSNIKMILAYVIIP